MTKKHTLVLKLRRHPSRPWGIRIAGGADLGTPIIVTRSENDDLRKGDVIKKIDDYDARDVRHVDAQNLLQNSESVRLVVERSEPLSNLACNRYTSQSSIVESIHSSNEAAFVSLPQESQPKILPKSPVPPVLSPPREYKTYSPDHFDPPREHIEEVREERFYLSQPYRTTPLVLPGAKIKKDAPLGECYLRHHPNPMIRAAPHHYEVAHPEVAMKQKVVHKQFNSPIGLYSEQNIADTIKCQTTAIPAMKPVKYDPSKSEAYKALQEEEMGYDVQEVSQPPRSGVFAPQRAHHHRQTHAPPKSPALSHASGYDDDGEKIHQSNSFKRIMYSVLGTTDY
ncbi:PDZ and LIM domain protein 3 isoform X6 [Microplitis mediator]|uniref:PDZ and LIM domain protein 3 isoform X5 n=1 Tax=Microplitis mediator TaxID=375433 RepID=UPI0025544E70|nr:PDZ and LIM domain protein 3 isoform X5 [Microplitis mediator]XP_057326996.1 PDZ and LIM domain protein 3 isoform X6 [Microplitis mediator]